MSVADAPAEIAAKSRRGILTIGRVNISSRSLNRPYP